MRDFSRKFIDYIFVFFLLLITYKTAFQTYNYLKYDIAMDKVIVFLMAGYFLVSVAFSAFADVVSKFLSRDRQKNS